MINSSYANRLVEMLPEEIRLIQQAKSGDTNAFVKLYDAYVERIYRYVYFQAADDQVAEGITFQIFFSAWKQLGGYNGLGSSFGSWLYLIARDQIITYYRTHKKSASSEYDFLISKAHNFGKEVEGIHNPQALRKALQTLTKEEQQILILKFIVDVPNKYVGRLMNQYGGNVRVLQFRALLLLAGYLEEKELKIDPLKTRYIIEECQPRLLDGTSTLKECLARYPENASQVEPLLKTVQSLNFARGIRPSPTFKEYTRATLLHYALSHPRLPKSSMVSSWRMSTAFAALIAALLFTGTVYAQSALPGESFYPWKRTSEQIWRSVSLNQVATDITLANRRLNEWVAVSNDPLLSANARNGYLDALSQVESHDNVETLAVIVPALQIQQQTLVDAGLVAPGLDNYLSVAVLLVPVELITQIPPTPTVAFTFTLIPSATDAPTDIPTFTDVPTDIPTETAIPTLFIPTATSTDIELTATDVPTETPTLEPTATDVPTETPTAEPTATDIPTETPTLEPTPTP